MSVNSICYSSVTIPADQGFSPNIDQYNKHVNQVIDTLKAFEQAVYDHDDKKQHEIAGLMCGYIKTVETDYNNLLKDGSQSEKAFAQSPAVANIFKDPRGLLFRPALPPFVTLDYAASSPNGGFMFFILADGRLLCPVSSMIDQFQAALAK